MRTSSLKYAALNFLNLWLDADRRLHTTVNSGSRSDKLAALGEAASRFRIARGFRLAHDTELGLERFEPILNLIDDLRSDDFTDTLTDSVLAVRDQISSLYGGTNLLSATTKFLWLKLRFPIVIYDRQARLALGTRGGDLHAYYDAWFDRYAKLRDEIATASLSLVDLGDYTCEPATANPTFLSSLVGEEWFHQRVFDIHLWNIGQNGG